jgi:hypothetical protein
VARRLFDAGLPLGMGRNKEDAMRQMLFVCLLSVTFTVTIAAANEKAPTPAECEDALKVWQRLGCRPSGDDGAIGFDPSSTKICRNIRKKIEACAYKSTIDDEDDAVFAADDSADRAACISARKTCDSAPCNCNEARCETNLTPNQARRCSQSCEQRSSPRCKQLLGEK